MSSIGFAEARLSQTLEPVGLDTLERRLRDAGLPARARSVPTLHDPALVDRALVDRALEPETDRTLLARFLQLLMPMCENTDRLAALALARFGSFAGLLAAPLPELRGVNGFGTHCLAGIKLLHEAALRLARSRMQDQPVLSDPALLLDYLTAVLARERIEQFRILFLDTNDRLLSDEAQARGTVNHTPVYPREVARRALELDASQIVLVHNHPSGDPTPSREDVEMTKQVVAACAVLHIAVRDHLIIGNGRWTSFVEQGLMGAG